MNYISNKSKDSIIVKLVIMRQWAELCPLKIHLLRSLPLVPQNWTVFGDRVFTEVSKLN